jgi:aryl-alcohol dehydrogenase-like predicted oxidoreductase
MKYKQLGHTGVFVSELCLGTSTFGGRGRFSAVQGNVDQNGARDLISGALGAGVNFIDTADVYSEGLAEQYTGQALKDLSVVRSDVIISTKCGGRAGDGPNDNGASRAHIMDSVARSLERLQTDHIDLYLLHSSDSVTPVEETVRALDDLTRQDMVRYVGCSNWESWRIMKALGIAENLGRARFEVLQAYYSVAGRDLEREYVGLIRDQKLGLMVWSPLAGGLLSGKYGPDVTGPTGSRRTLWDFPPVDRERAWRCVALMREMGNERGVSVARIALAYVLHKPFVTSVLVGARTLEQLDDNLAAARVDLSAQEMAALDAASALPPEYPSWIIELLGQYRIPTPK